MLITPARRENDLGTWGIVATRTLVPADFDFLEVAHKHIFSLAKKGVEVLLECTPAQSEGGTLCIHYVPLMYT